jgi:hypothetical protein
MKDVIMNFRSRLVITKIFTKNDNLKLGLNLSIMGGVPTKKIGRRINDEKTN